MRMKKQSMNDYLIPETLVPNNSTGEGKTVAGAANVRLQERQMVARDRRTPTLIISLLMLLAFGAGSIKALAVPDVDKDSQNLQGKTERECAGTFVRSLTLASANRNHGADFKWSYLESFDDKKADPIELFRDSSFGSSFGEDLDTFAILSVSRNGDDSCDEQLKAIEEIEKQVVEQFLLTRQEWEKIGRNFPANSKRHEKTRIAYADDSETEAVKLVDEILRNGALEDSFLKEFNWERFRNDVQFALAYLKSCRNDFQGLRRSLKKQAERTDARLVKLEKLNKELGKLLDEDRKKFIGSNNDTVGWEDFAKRALRGGAGVDLVVVIKDFHVALRNAADVGTRTALLPRLLERTETLAYLNALVKRYDAHLNMQNVILDDIDKAYTIRDCEKCRGKSTKPVKKKETPDLWVAGDWYTSYGVMKLDQTGNKVKGTYATDGGRVEGEMSGNQMNGFWAENDSAHKCDTEKLGSYYWGQIRIDFKGEHFVAKWNYCGRGGLTEGGWGADLIKLRERK